MKSASVTVPARKDGWTDTGIYVKKGDVMQVRAKGSWKMVEHRPPAGPEGWDAGAQHKIEPNARAGALILRVSVSENMSPAYLGMPIPAETQGSDLGELIHGPPSEVAGRGEAVSSLYLDGQSLRSIELGGLKLIQQGPSTHTWAANRGDQLFDLRKDPAEQHNLIGELSAAAGYLRSRLDASSAMRAPRHDREQISIDEGLEEHLRALGYAQ